MNHQIYLANIFHARMETVSNKFRYRVPYFLIDLQNIKDLEQNNLFFSHNKPNIFSLYDKDYIESKSGSIIDSLRGKLAELGCQLDISKAYLVTVPRFFQYVFNPVNFYYCFDSNDKWNACVAEVNNTFGERHLYILDELPDAESSLARFLKPRNFHVSPFIEEGGDYEFFFGQIEQNLDIRINIRRDNKVVFHSYIKGIGETPSNKTTLKILGRAPVHASLSWLRIMYEAFKLHYVKKVAVYHKPVPQSAFTVKEATPRIIDKFGRKIFDQLVGKIECGKLTVTYPNGETTVFGSGNETDLTAELHIKEWYFFGRLLKDADLGIAESYILKEWETDDLTQLISLFADHQDLLSYNSVLSNLLKPFLRLYRYTSRKNNREGARKNISAHYDLGNDFFDKFLDPSMMYSSAFYKSKDETLTEAQINKLDALVEQARITKDDHVLEIGTGWGGFSIHAAQKTGCKITTVTISKEQFEFAKQKVASLGLSDQIDVRFSDYRDIEGKFDKIVSIEMLEAIGHSQLPEFFRKCDDLLNPDGLLVLQVITMPEQRYKQYLKHGDFIEKFIFPGAVCPSLSAITDAACKQTSFLLETAHNIGPHYAKTLKEWRERFLAKGDSFDKKRFDTTFLRTWLYYLCYCEAGFARRVIGNFHLTFTRANNRSLINKDLSFLHES